MWVRRGFLRRNPTNPIFLLNVGFGVYDPFAGIA
jgi:hypothetical protein